MTFYVEKETATEQLQKYDSENIVIMKSKCWTRIENNYGANFSQKNTRMVKTMEGDDLRQSKKILIHGRTEVTRYTARQSVLIV